MSTDIVARADETLTGFLRGEVHGITPGFFEQLVGELKRLRDVAPQLRAFARDCVTHGDMTPGAKRMLEKIADDVERRHV